MMQKFPQIEGRFNPPVRPLTILSIGHPQRWARTLARVLPLLFTDPLALASVAYWLIDVPQGTDDGTYNVARAFNDALWECKSPVVVFSTGDVLILPELLFRAYGTHLGMGAPVVTMRQDESEEGENREIKENDHAIGDFMLMPRAWAIEAGGWDERMISWGFADYAFCLQLERIGYPAIILGRQPQDRVIHLWHRRREDAWYRAQNEKNRRIFCEEPPWTKADFLVGRVRAEVEV